MYHSSTSHDATPLLKQVSQSVTAPEKGHASIHTETYQLLDDRAASLAEYVRVGNDLVVQVFNQQQVIEDYFVQADKPVLLDAQGAVIEVASLGVALQMSDVMVAAGGKTALQAGLVLIGRATLVVDGPAKVVNANGTSRTLDTGDPVYLNDTVSTGSRTYVKIQLQDGTVFQLGPLSNASLEKYEYQQANASTHTEAKGEFEASVFSGIFRFISGSISNSNQGTHSVIKTPSAVIGIRGSEIDGQVQTDGTTVILHMEGLIDIRPLYSFEYFTVFEPGTRIEIPITPLEPFSSNIAEFDYVQTFRSFLAPLNPHLSDARLETHQDLQGEGHFEGRGGPQDEPGTDTENGQRPPPNGEMNGEEGEAEHRPPPVHGQQRPEPNDDRPFDEDQEFDPLEDALEEGRPYPSPPLNAEGEPGDGPGNEFNNPIEPNPTAPDNPDLPPDVLPGPGIAPPTSPDTPVSIRLNGVEDETLVIDRLPGTDDLNQVVFVQPTHGQIERLANGQLLYTPAPDFNGEDSFSYRIANQNTVYTVNILLAASDDRLQGNTFFASMNEDGLLSIPVADLLQGISHDDGTPITAVELVGLEKIIDATGQDLAPGILQVDTDSNSVVYIPAADYFGDARFQYRVIDAAGNISDPITVAVEIQGFKRCPTNRRQCPGFYYQCRRGPDAIRS